MLELDMYSLKTKKKKKLKPDFKSIKNKNKRKDGIK